MYSCILRLKLSRVVLSIVWHMCLDKNVSVGVIAQSAQYRTYRINGRSLEDPSTAERETPDAEAPTPARLASSSI